MAWLGRVVGGIWRDRRGVAATEFALVLPILLLFSAGTIEYSRLILLTQKLQSGSFLLADLAARDRTLSEEQVQNLFLAIDNVLQPFPFAARGRAIVTSVGANAAGQPVVNWQRQGEGVVAFASTLGAEGAVAELPESLELAPGETVVAAEVFYAFEPLFGVGLAPRTLRRVAYYRPRLGTLDALRP